MTPNEDTIDPERKLSGCLIDICIESRGDVNIYNCTAPSATLPPPRPCDEAFPPLPPAEGACVPLALGAKPKQSRKRKIEKLLANNPVASALAGSFFHLSRRFLDGRPAGNLFEKSVFDLLGSLPLETKGVLSCALGSFDSLSHGDRYGLFGSAISTDPNQPLDEKTLAAAFAAELVGRVGDQVYGARNGVAEERPGRNRFYDQGPTAENFDIQFRICRVDGLRTGEFAPPLNPGDYLPAEIQQHCQPIVVSGQPQLDCKVQQGNCPGNFLADQTCLRVPQVQTGRAVTLEGVNFISVDAKVRITAQASSTIKGEVDAHVVGDLDTPLSENVDGVDKPIRDCRVRDRLTFVVPADLPPGVYSIQIVMPNVTGFANLAGSIVSNTQFIEVIPPPTARFQIASEILYARKETAPVFPGSDEVRVRVSAFPITATLTSLILGEEQRFNSPEYGDVDSGEIRDMTAVLFQQSAPLDGVVIAITGYEIDSDKAYRDQINNFTDAFHQYLKIALEAIARALNKAADLLGVRKLIDLGLAHPVILAIASAVTLGVIAFLALWAPADLIIEDALGLTIMDLVTLTNANLPLPSLSSHTSQQGLRVNVTPLEKIPTQYRERREYVSNEEESRYEITFRYNRVA